MRRYHILISNTDQTEDFSVSFLFYQIEPSIYIIKSPCLSSFSDLNHDHAPFFLPPPRHPRLSLHWARRQQSQVALSAVFRVLLHHLLLLSAHFLAELPSRGCRRAVRTRTPPCDVCRTWQCHWRPGHLMSLHREQPVPVRSLSRGRCAGCLQHIFHLFFGLWISHFLVLLQFIIYIWYLLVAWIKLNKQG